jgi:hypothetical protein
MADGHVVAGNSSQNDATKVTSELILGVVQESFDAFTTSEASMVTTTDSLTRRIVVRFLAAKSSRSGGPDRQAFILNLPAPKPHIPDNLVLQCSSRCTLTALEVEQMLPARLKVAPGSCRIERVPADAEVNRTRFEVKTIDGKTVTGTITVNIVASERRVDAFSIVDLDT